MSNVRNGDSAIGIVLNAPAWSGVFPEETRDMRVFGRMLRAMETAEIRVRVDGVEVRANLVGTFKSPILAQRYSKDLVDSLPKVTQILQGGGLSSFKPTLEGSVVSLNIIARLDIVWEGLRQWSRPEPEKIDDAGKGF